MRYRNFKIFDLLTIMKKRKCSSVEKVFATNADNPWFHSFDSESVDIIYECYSVE